LESVVDKDKALLVLCVELVAERSRIVSGEIWQATEIAGDPHPYIWYPVLIGNLEDSLAPIEKVDEPEMKKREHSGREYHENEGNGAVADAQP
jgi:hypothetical protein